MGAFASIQPFFTFPFRFLSHWYWILFLPLAYCMFRSLTNAFMSLIATVLCLCIQLLMSFYCKSVTIPGLSLAVSAAVLMIYSPSVCMYVYVCMYVCACIYTCRRLLFREVGVRGMEQDKFVLNYDTISKICCFFCQKVYTKLILKAFTAHYLSLVGITFLHASMRCACQWCWFQLNLPRTF